MRTNNANKTFLIVRLSSLGDVIIASPFAKLLKEQYPDSKIIWITQPENAAHLADNPHVDKILFWDKNIWLNYLKTFNVVGFYKESRKLKQLLAKESIDTAFDLQGLFKSGFITWLSGATKRIGVGSREGSYWFMDKMVSTGMINRHQLGADYKYLATQLGLNDQNWKIESHVGDRERRQANTIKASLVKTDEPYAVICPFASKETKDWPLSHWQQLLLRVRGRYHYRTIILGSEADTKHKERADKLAKISGAINLFGATTLQEAAALIEGAEFVVGLDNGLTHISQSMSVPSVLLLGGSLPYLYTGNPTSKAIHLGKPCSPCQKKPICNGGFECMKDINPDLVLAELRQLLKNKDKNRIHSSSI